MKITRKLKQFFLPAALIFITAAFSGAYYSDSEDIRNNSFSAATWSVTPVPEQGSRVKLNEVMVNPLGTESAPRPDGEWVELFNEGSSSIDVDGWFIYDNTSSNYFTVTAAKTNTGNTIIAPGGYLAVYRNTTAIFNNAGDEVRLYDGPISSSNLIDSMTYESSSDGVTWSRVPNGSGLWTDGHEKTPGGPNA